MRIFLLYILIFTASIILPRTGFTQTPGKISGIITDTSKNPISFVTVRVFKPNNLQKPLQTILSKEDGTFQFNLPEAGNYILAFTHSSFAEKKQEISVQPGGDLKLDPVKLTRATGTLKEVVVTAQKPLVEQAEDKIVFNVDQDPTAKSETAIEILRRTPFVTVDADDNIKVNGKSNFKVLLNNRETSMFAKNVKDALRGFPGALIEKIEVITIPSAKYDGEGVGGVINIITKKKVVGYNGTISSFSRTSDKLQNFSLNANAKFGKIGASVFYNMGASQPVTQENINTTIPTIPTAYSKRTLDGFSKNSGDWNFGNAEISWEIDTLNALSVYTNIDSWSNKVVSDQTITTEYVTGPPSVSYYNLDDQSDNPSISIGTDYIRKFRKNKGREFSLKFFGEFGQSDAHLNSAQDGENSDRFLVNNSKAKNDQYTIQADHILPVNKTSKFEAGLKGILRRASSDFESLVKYDPADKYELNPTNTDNFNYAQDVLSAYAMYSFKVKKSSFRLGTRVEFTNVDGNFTSSNTMVKDQYTTLLPNIMFTNSISKLSTLTLSYNKRLSRPYIWDLNPFVVNNDSLNITYGNPELGPQTIHVVSAQLRYGKGATFAGINIDGSYSDNKILPYSTYDPHTGITETTSLNIGEEFQSSLNLNLNTRFTPKWSFNVNGALRYSTVTNKANKEQSNSGFGCNFNMFTTYRFMPKFSISSYVGIWREPVTIQTTYPFNTWYNVAVNYKVFKEKLNISVRTVNFFEKTHDYKTVVEDDDFYTTNINRQIRRGAVLALTYNFGKLSENVSKKKGVNNDDLLSKPQGPPVN